MVREVPLVAGRLASYHRLMTEQLFDPGADRGGACHESQACSFDAVTRRSSEPTVAGLFAGIGGIETGLAASGLHSELLCEVWDPARAVLEARFPDVEIRSDVRALRSLPAVEIVTAGFPCQDLSQAGRTAGIDGTQSGLVTEVFRLLRRRHPRWLVLENVQFMLQLEGGRAMRYLVDELEAMKYRWAYRVVDSRFTGVPQRRRRVVLVASRTEDPREVLFADDAGVPPDSRYDASVCGFYWTEGLRGLGWAVDAVPTLKGGSTIGIPSPPAIWVTDNPAGRRIVVPGIEDAEAMQGFDRGWTSVIAGPRALGTRWKLVGNAVTVGMSTWLGERLAEPGSFHTETAELENGAPWPRAASGARGRTYRVDVSEYPRLAQYQHLASVVDLEVAAPLSQRAGTGFLNRADRSTLRFDATFLDDLAEHVAVRTEPLFSVA
jgi:DNA (cytosine-5)-methyltransferase 1